MITLTDVVGKEIVLVKGIGEKILVAFSKRLCNGIL